MNVLRRLLLSCLLAVAAVPGVWAQWIDVTGYFLTNPNFDTGNIDGWTVAINGYQNGGYQGASYSNGSTGISGFVEVWYPGRELGDGEIYQDVTLPKGRYRLSADCIAVWQNDAYVQPWGASLFIRSDNGLDASECSLATANNSPQHFEIEFTMEYAGGARLGVMTDETNCSWLAADNFRLEMHRDDMNLATRVTVTPSSTTLVPGETLQLGVQCVPANATAMYSYSSSNASVATVDGSGCVAGNSPGKASITVESLGGARAVCQVEVKAAAYVEGSIVINEIQASNVDCVMDPSFNYGSWIELYNPTGKVCGLGGLYVTDDPNDLTKHRLPYMMPALQPHSYKNLWFDHYGIWNKGELMQVPFKLDYDGGTIIISDGETVLVQQDYPEAIGRASYARTVDGGDTWGWSSTPTPEKSNTDMTFASKQLAAPVVDKPGQVISGTLVVNVTVPAGQTLIYTTNGSTPTLANGTKVTRNTSFLISTSRVYRLRLFQDGYIPSEVVTHSYIKDTSGKAIISMVTSDANLNSQDYGIFKKGPNGRPGNGQDDKCNWNMDWDRPANFEYFTEEGGPSVISQEVDMAVCGGWSRAWEPHSFKIKSGKYYLGKNSLDYQFFDGKPYLKHKVLQIRNGGNNGLLKDASLQEIMRRSGLNIETQSWRPVRVYINGKFYAQLNMREPNNKHYGYANYGIDTDEMDQFEMSPDSGYVQVQGTRESMDRLLELSRNAADAATYAQIGKLLDIDEFINYIAAEIYLGSNDWPRNNMKAFRDKNDGRFRFVIYDLDAAFSYSNPLYEFKTKKTWTFDRLRGEDALGNVLWNKTITKDVEVVHLFENLLKNQDFRRRFVDALCIVGGSVFHPDFARPIIAEMRSLSGVSDNDPTYSITTQRQADIASLLYNGTYDFGVGASSKVNVTLGSNVDGAGIHINDMPVPTGSFSGVLYHPVTLTAVAPAGYRFKGWRLTSGSIVDDSKAETVFGKGSEWQYYDVNATTQYSTSWRTSSGTNASWKVGRAPVGYDEASNPKGIVTWFTNKNKTTYYLRRAFTLDKKEDGEKFVLRYTVDDGMVVYINGTEAGRYNMPSGTVSGSTLSSTWAVGNPDSGEMELPAGLFSVGTNVIAVEVHNTSTSSTDIFWDAALLRIPAGGGQDGSQYACETRQFTLPQGSNMAFEATFEPIPAGELEGRGVFPVKVNEVSAGNDIYVNDYFKKDDWIELYNTTDEEIDVAGMYLSDNESKPQKFQIPANDVQETVIAPHGRLVVWASKRNNKGKQVHASFKLGNGDGECVLLTSEDGSWSHRLSYNQHGAKESVGLYPDGGNDVYLMQLPSIGKANGLTSYASFLYHDLYEPEKPEDGAFTLFLTEGWNWISHPLKRDIATSEINAMAQRIMSQTAEAVKDNQYGWVGNLSHLAAGCGYKVLMSQDATYRFEGDLATQDAGITLQRGWNWVGYPLMGSQDLASAMSLFTAAEGDVIISRSGFATFEKGKWGGSLGTLSAGHGYLYKSGQGGRLLFAQSSGRKAVAPRFVAQPVTPWTTTDAGYPDVMALVATVVAGGAEAAEGAYSVGAFDSEGVCRGIGYHVDGRIFITVMGNPGEKITFKAMDAATGVIHEVREQLLFVPDVRGSRQSPFELHVGVATDVARPTGAGMKAVDCYNIDGTRSAGRAGRGVSIMRYRLDDGTVISKKVVR